MLSLLRWRHGPALAFVGLMNTSHCISYISLMYINRTKKNLTLAIIACVGLRWLSLAVIVEWGVSCWPVLTVMGCVMRP